MLKKLHGIEGNNQNWIKSFLWKKKQYDETDPQQKLFLECGVPQGSGTSTIFFIWKLSQKHFKSPRSAYVCRRCKSFIHAEKYVLTNGQELITKNESLKVKKVK